MGHSQEAQTVTTTTQLHSHGFGQTPDRAGTSWCALEQPSLDKNKAERWEMEQRKRGDEDKRWGVWNWGSDTRIAFNDMSHCLAPLCNWRIRDHRGPQDYAHDTDHGATVNCTD